MIIADEDLVTAWLSHGLTLSRVGPEHTDSEVSYGTIHTGNYEGNDLCNSAIDDEFAGRNWLG